MISRTLRLAVLSTLTFAVATPASGQYAVGTGVDYLGYTFEDGLGTDAAQLFVLPFAVRLPVSDALTFDLFTAWAEGRVEQSGATATMSGLVDSSIKASFAATPWALVSVGVNIPTGNSAHNDEEAIVANILSTDLYGFREATWGTGLAITSSIATAAQAGGFGFGIAGAYAARSEFEPTEDDAFTYQPGNEIRIRAGIDRNFGNSTLILGATFINYAQDKANGSNLFQAGNRIRFDGSFAFRAASGVWTVYAADLIRQNGDLRVPILDQGGVEVDATNIETAKQNLMVGGIMGTVGLGGGFVFRPHVEVKIQQREEADGNEVGSGRIIAVGGDIPIRLFGGYDFFPKARVYFGTIKSEMAEDVNMLGVEFKGTIRIQF